MSKHNKVNPGQYYVAGRLTPDEMARERLKQLRVAHERVTDAPLPPLSKPRAGAASARSAANTGAAANTGGAGRGGARKAAAAPKRGAAAKTRTSGAGGSRSRD